MSPCNLPFNNTDDRGISSIGETCAESLESLGLRSLCPAAVKPSPLQQPSQYDAGVDPAGTASMPAVFEIPRGTKHHLLNFKKCLS